MILLHRAVVAALVVSLALGLFTPLYSDEIGWRFQLARSVFDGGGDRYIAEACRSPMIAAPWFVQPLRWASAWGNALVPFPAAVRWFGVAMAVAICAALALVVRRAGGGRVLAVLMFGALGLGLLPFLFVWSRPEQPILLCVVLAVACGLWRPATSKRYVWLAGAGIVLLAVVVIGYHLKAMFYLPVFLAAIWTAAPGVRARVARGVASAVLIAAAAGAYPYWATRFLCPGDPLVDAIHRAENLGATLAAPGARVTGASLWAALKSAGPSEYVANILPGWIHMSEWIAPTHLPDGLVGAWRAGVSAGWALLLAAGVAALIAGCVRGVRGAGVERRLVLAVALAVSLLGWSTAQLNNNAYESMLWLPLAALACVLSLSVFCSPAEAGVQARYDGGDAMRITADVPTGPRPSPGTRVGGYIGVLAAIIGVLAVESQVLLWADNARLIPASRASGVVPGQALSINLYGYDAAAILAAGAKCGIGPRAPRVTIDDWTYFAYQRSYRPIYAVGVFGRWRGAIVDPVAYLRSQGSPGVVAACSSLPVEMVPGIRRSGQLCCFATGIPSGVARPPG